MIAERRALLLEAVAGVDDELGELFLNEVEPTVEQFRVRILHVLRLQAVE